MRQYNLQLNQSPSRPQLHDPTVEVEKVGNNDETTPRYEVIIGKMNSRALTGSRYHEGTASHVTNIVQSAHAILLSWDKRAPIIVLH